MICRGLKFSNYDPVGVSENGKKKKRKRQATIAGHTRRS